MEILVVSLRAEAAASRRLIEALRSDETLARIERRIRNLAGVRELARIVHEEHSPADAGARERGTSAAGLRVDFVIGAARVKAPAGAVAEEHDEDRLSKDLRRAFAQVVSAIDSPTASPEVSGHVSSENELDLRAGDGNAHEHTLRDGVTIAVHAGDEVFRHLLRAAVSIGGDREDARDPIDAFRAAYAAAVERAGTGPILRDVFHQLFRAARRLRSVDLAHPVSESPRWSESSARESVPGPPRPAADSLHPFLQEPTGGSAATLAARIDLEVSRFRAWREEREAAAGLVRIGRLLEATSRAGENGERESLDARFRARLVRAIAALADEAADDIEARGRVHLFEEALRRVTAEPPARTSSAHTASLPSSTRSVDERIHSVRPANVDAFTLSDGPRVHERGGTVSLVGAGPGDPGLLTVRAAERLAQADVVYYDALVSPEILVLCRSGAELISVGKRRGQSSAFQDEIEAALIASARAGRFVIRLKGGDPFVFGRGGEEALALVRAGIACEIVPGLTSGTAVPALAGIPLTHRGLASSAAFLTARDLDGAAGTPAVRRRLRHLARGAETLVLYMAGAELSGVKAALTSAGLSPATPAALIESGTTPRERVRVTTLAALDAPHESAGGPVLAIVGRTVALSEALRAPVTALRAGARAQQQAHAAPLVRVLSSENVDFPPDANPRTSARSQARSAVRPASAAARSTRRAV